jgi:hypothetical protein
MGRTAEHILASHKYFGKWEIPINTWSESLLNRRLQRSWAERPIRSIAVFWGCQMSHGE